MNTKNCSTPELLSVLIGNEMAKKLSQVPLSVLFGMRANRQEMVCENEAHLALLTSSPGHESGLYVSDCVPCRIDVNLHSTFDKELSCFPRLKEYLGL